MANLDLWNKLGKTDPAHTKGFKRAGGFGGTAIKPIYTEQKMTEVFGPAGKGWGMGEPSFQVVPGNEGQVAVYCTVGLWWCDLAEKNDDFGPTQHTVFGVGGDMVVVKQSAGLRTDDEAFKKAFTDAVGNAMKHLGMSADVHMGLFDDDKYVNELRDEFSTDPSPPKQLVKESRESEKALRVEVDACGTVAELKDLWDSKAFQTEYVKLHKTYQDGLVEMFNDRLVYLKANPANHGKGYVPPNFDAPMDLKERLTKSIELEKAKEIPFPGDELTHAQKIARTP